MFSRLRWRRHKRAVERNHTLDVISKPSSGDSHDGPSPYHILWPTRSLAVTKSVSNEVKRRSLYTLLCGLMKGPWLRNHFQCESSQISNLVPIATTIRNLKRKHLLPLANNISVVKPTFVPRLSYLELGFYMSNPSSCLFQSLSRSYLTPNKLLSLLRCKMESVTSDPDTTRFPQ